MNAIYIQEQAQTPGRRAVVLVPITVHVFFVSVWYYRCLCSPRVEELLDFIDFMSEVLAERWCALARSCSGHIGKAQHASGDAVWTSAKTVEVHGMIRIALG
jgi:hypothetical protein